MSAPEQFGARGPVAAIVAPMGDYRIDDLSSGYKWGTSTLTYSFFNGGPYYGSESSPTPVSDAVKANVRYILSNVIAPIINVSFVEVTDSPTSYGLLRYLCSSAASYAYAYVPTGSDTNSGTSGDVCGDVVLNPSYDVVGTDFNSRNNSFQTGPGSHGFSALIHETGHALGLKHPFEFPALPRAEENFENSVMTYNFVGSEPATMMAYDILALQSFYGTNSGTTGRNGNTSYTFTNTDTFSPGSPSTGAPTQPFGSMKNMLWDGGGTDVVDLSALPPNSGGYRIDVRPGGWITTNSSYNSVTYDGSTYRTTDEGTRIPLSGSVIENVVASRSSDAIYLNSAANRISGYSPGVAGGADIVYGGDQADVLDLSLFLRANAVETQSGNDLVISLGTAGQVTLKDYYTVVTSLRTTVVYMDPPPTASISDASVREGDSGETLATFTITLSAVPTQQAVLAVATQDGSATVQNNDYVPLAPGATVTFAPGQTTATVQVRISGDTTFEPDENFSVVLSSPQRVLIGRGTGACLIRNDDPVPPPAITISDARTEEGNAGTTVVSLVIALSWAAPQDVVVSYQSQDLSATAADSDYVAIPVTSLVIPAGQTTGTIVVAVVGDRKPEDDEAFAIVLSNPVNATLSRGTGVCTIVNDDIGFASVTRYVVEGTNTTKIGQIPVSLLGGVTSPLTIYYQTVDGSAKAGIQKDYRETRGVLTFLPADNSFPGRSPRVQKQISVSIMGDSLPERDEDFTVRLRFSAAGLARAALNEGEADIRVVVVDDDSRYFRIEAASPSVAAGATASFNVSLGRLPGYGDVLPPIYAAASGLENVVFQIRFVVGNTPVKTGGRWSQGGNIEYRTGLLAFGYIPADGGCVAITSRRIEVPVAGVSSRRSIVAQVYTLDNSRQDIGSAFQSVIVQ